LAPKFNPVNIFLSGVEALLQSFFPVVELPKQALFFSGFFPLAIPMLYYGYVARGYSLEFGLPHGGF